MSLNDFLYKSAKLVNLTTVSHFYLHKMIKWVHIFLQLACALKLAEYRFSIDFGQVFIDYSGNVQTAVSGSSSSTEANDVVCTDRGIYFSGGDSRVTNPANDQQLTGFVLPSN